MKILDLMRHVQQPTPDTCMSACLAMITGVQVEDIVSNYHQRFKDGLPLHSALADFGMDCSVNSDIYAGMNGEGVYLLIVPSLNIKAVHHQIIYVIEKSDTDDYYHQIFDPNKNKDSRQWYEVSPSADNNSEVGLGAFIVECSIPIDQVISRLTCADNIK